LSLAPKCRGAEPWSSQFLLVIVLRSATRWSVESITSTITSRITGTSRSRRRIMVKVAGIVVLIASGGFGLTVAGQGTDQEELAKVVEEVEALNSMRSALAASITGDADQSTFAQVCKPVGARVKTLMEENGWKVAQLAEKYRNPNNKLDWEAKLAYKMMEDSPELMGFWKQTEMDGEKGVRYFRRIVVESSCLACHGKKADRPEFMKEGYPDDRAYGFKEGELRGIYSVFVAD